jgi:hypothetical protein
MLPRILTAVPQALQVRLEIANAIRKLFEQDESDQLQKRQQFEAPTAQIAEEVVRDIYHELSKAGFRPDQPRWRKGSGRRSGRWSGGAGLAAAGIISARLRGGHHYGPREIFSKQPLKPETTRVFENAVTGKLSPGDHGWNLEHRNYNKAVFGLWKAFLDKKGIDPADVTPEQAKEFLDIVKYSNNPQIRDFDASLRH